MSKLSLTPGTTSQIIHVFIYDSTATTGAGKTALIHSDITAYYVRAGGTLTALTMETISTLGTWASTGDNYLGFKLLNDTNAPGVYELCLPNNILAAGTNQVVIQLRATGAAPCNIEIQLANVPSNVKAVSDDSTAADNLEAMLDGTGGVTLTTAIVGSITGNLSGSVGSVAGAVGSVTAMVTSNAIQISGDASAANKLEALLDGTGISQDVNLTMKSLTIANAGGTAIAVAGNTDALSITGNVLMDIIGSLSGSVGSVTGHTPQTGDSFALLGSPAVSVSADIAAVKADTGNLISRLGAWAGSGVNTVLGAFKAIASKVASAPSDIGGTFAPASHSLEAQRERGDAAWITGDLTVTPLSSTVSAGQVSDTKITCYQYQAFGPYVLTITDSDDAAVDLSASDLVFRVYRQGKPGTVLWSLTSTAGEITVAGASNNQVTLEDDDTHTESAGQYRWVLWDSTNDLVRGRGVLMIEAEAASGY